MLIITNRTNNLCLILRMQWLMISALSMRPQWHEQVRNRHQRSRDQIPTTEDTHPGSGAPSLFLTEEEAFITSQLSVLSVTSNSTPSPPWLPWAHFPWVRELYIKNLTKIAHHVWFWLLTQSWLPSSRWIFVMREIWPHFSQKAPDGRGVPGIIRDVGAGALCKMWFLLRLQIQQQMNG